MRTSTGLPVFLGPLGVLVTQNHPGPCREQGSGGRKCLAQLLTGAGTSRGLSEDDTESASTCCSWTAGDGAAWPRGAACPGSDKTM